MRPRHPAAIRIAVLAFVSLSACGGSGGGYPTGSGGQNPPPGQQPPPSTSNAILVKNNRFEPAATTVTGGTTVTWTWDACSDDGYGERTCVDHSVTFDGGSGSPTQSTGTYSRRFDAAGTFNYHCTVHGSSMTGQVVVR
ncbi:MAG: plastocyanin/azurin family copper-binding protein [Gemmatimonadota bacterium]|nr:plastocyanin/azurin family copper-binding protein [Gemmatimonadota bacterium]